MAGVVGGIGVASLFPQLAFDYTFTILLTLLLFCIAARKRFVGLSVYVAVLAVFLGAISLGVWRTDVYTESVFSNQRNDVGSEVVVEGVVVKEPDERANTTQYTVQSEGVKYLVMSDRFSDISYGDRIQATGKLSVPESFETEYGRTFDYAGYLASRGISYVVSFANIEIVSHNEGNPFISHLLTLKANFLTAIERQLPEPQAGLAEGLLLGVKRALGEDLEQVFRSTGIIHIVVLSGYNIMLVVAFVMYMLAFLLPWRARLCVGVIAIVSFALMVGLSSTVMRASLMAALALVAKGVGRTYTVLHALFVAGLVMLLFNPYLLVYDVGFQLSFLATLGLILVAPLLEKVFTSIPSVIGIRDFFTATLATQLLVLPILLYQIGEFSVVSVLVNVLVLPMVPVAMLATFLMIVLGKISVILSLPFVYIAYGSLTYIIETANLFGTLPVASFIVPPFPFYGVVIAYGVIGYLLWRWYRPNEKSETRDWIIEEETEIAIDKNTRVTPVFFR